MNDSQLITSESDAIAPIEIQHHVDELIVDGEMEQYYNYLDYHFEKYGAYCRARVYLFESDTVSLFGPLKNRDSIELVEAPALIEEVIAYFKRRYPVIQALGDESYKTVWKHPDYKLGDESA